MPQSDSLLRTDSLSSNEPVLSDGSVGSAPTLGLSPGPAAGMDMNRTDMTRAQEKMMKQQQQQKAQEVSDMQAFPTLGSRCHVGSPNMKMGSRKMFNLTKMTGIISEYNLEVGKLLCKSHTSCL